MKNEFTNRLDSFRTTLKFLHMPANQALWSGQPPLRFGVRVGEADLAVTELAEFCRQQGVVITGSAADKAREEAELEQAAFVLGQAVAECYRSLGNEADAAKADFSLTRWQRMRDATLLSTARTVIGLAIELANGANSSAATECGVTLTAAATCTKEADDFHLIISAPQQAIAGKKALTGLLRDRFNTVEEIFVSMDGLVEQFTDKVFVAGYHAARTVRDLGHGPGAPVPPPPSPQPPAPPAPPAA